MMIPTTVVESALLYFVMPLWILAGLADWLCHRIARIEYSAGPVESVIHVLMLAEAGVAVLAALFLEITGAILLFLFGVWLIHEVTAYWDLHYASSRRIIAPWEQRVHDYLANTPVLALLLVAILHWPQVAAIFGAGPEHFDAGIRLKQEPVPTGYILIVLGAILALNVLPFVFELGLAFMAAARREVSQQGAMLAHPPHAHRAGPLPERPFILGASFQRPGRLFGRGAKSRV
jgi:hypothetical protein